jgi:hypothetical protein
MELFTDLPRYHVGWPSIHRILQRIFILLLHGEKQVEVFPELFMADSFVLIISSGKGDEKKTIFPRIFT